MTDEKRIAELEAQRFLMFDEMEELATLRVERWLASGPERWQREAVANLAELFSLDDTEEAVAVLDDAIVNWLEDALRYVREAQLSAAIGQNEQIGRYSNRLLAERDKRIAELEAALNLATHTANKYIKAFHRVAQKEGEYQPDYVAEYKAQDFIEDAKGGK